MWPFSKITTLWSWDHQTLENVFLAGWLTWHTVSADRQNFEGCEYTTDAWIHARDVSHNNKRPSVSEVFCLLLPVFHEVEVYLHVVWSVYVRLSQLVRYVMGPLIRDRSQWVALITRSYSPLQQGGASWSHVHLWFREMILFTRYILGSFSDGSFENYKIQC